MRELDAAVLTERDYRDSRKIEQYVIERLEQIIEITREIEDEKAEYRMVNSYLADVELLEGLPEEDRQKIEETAVNVVQLNSARTDFLNSSKKLTDAQFSQLEQEEDAVPAAVRRLSSNEAYRDTLDRDLKYLEREKSEWQLRKEYLGHQKKKLKNSMYIAIGTAITAAVLFVIIQLVLAVDMYYGYFGLVFFAVAAVCGIQLKLQNDSEEIAAAERNLNRAIQLQNKVKIKYVNIVNAIDYACEKYHVRNSDELNRQWQYYMEAVKEREKYQRTNEDLEYFNGRLVRILDQYRLHDSRVWVTQAAALVDAKEMVEVKHGLIGRRQKLRGRIEFNLGAIKELKTEAEKLVDKVGDRKPQIQEILSSIEKLEKVI